MIENKQTVQQWQEWNQQGFIPGPEETEIDFIKRVEFCQNIKQILSEQAKEALPFAPDLTDSSLLLQEALPKTQNLYGISPTWVPVFCCNYHLAPWHGGCAWIFQLNEKTPTAAFLQLRAHFRHFSTYLGLYHRSDLMAHELAHVGRMMYQSPKFEEILAYQSSSLSWQRYLSPLIQSPKESLFFILTLGLVVLTDLATLSLNQGMIVNMAWGLKLLPLLLLILALSRLIYRQGLFRKCLEHLTSLYAEPLKAKHLTYRLLDCEIKEFAHLSSQQIQHFMQKSSSQSFRWRFLATLYGK